MNIKCLLKLFCHQKIKKNLQHSIYTAVRYINDQCIETLICSLQQGLLVDDLLSL